MPPTPENVYYDFGIDSRFHGEGTPGTETIWVRSFHEPSSPRLLMHDKSGALRWRGKGPFFSSFFFELQEPTVRDTETKHFYAREKTRVLYVAERFSVLSHRINTCKSKKRHIEYFDTYIEY